MTIRRRLAQIDPDAFLHDLAMSLNNLGSYFAVLDSQEEALSAAEEAVTIRRRLAQANPDVHLPDLSRSLLRYAMVCAVIDSNLSEALSATNEAIAICEQLVS